MDGFNTIETQDNWKPNVKPEKADPAEHKKAVERPRKERKRKEKQNEKQNEKPGPTKPTGSSAFEVSALSPLIVAALVLLG